MSTDCPRTFSLTRLLGTKQAPGCYTGGLLLLGSGPGVLSPGRTLGTERSEPVDARLSPWAVGFFFTKPELSMELWTVIAGISGFDD